MDRIDVNTQRQQRFAHLSAHRLDLLVVGGGIVGAGVARDAAMRRLRVGLVEQHDMAFGTSSRSSRLLHGGLRYLAQGRIGLVYEASREKRVLHHIAPHLAEPLAFLFPAYRRTRWPLWQLRIGVKLYDLLCRGRNLGASSSLNRQSTLALLPELEARNLAGAVRYFDGLTHDARLVLDTLRSAAAAGAAANNYARLEDASRHDAAWRCSVRDRLSDRCHEIEASVVVNAAGPWAPTLPHHSIRLRLTKGVHLVVDRSRIPIPDAVVMTHEDRILFAIPWGKRVILGTTDTDYDDSIEQLRTEPADVDYVLGVVNRAFPSLHLRPPDVLASWAGLRPLIADARGRPSDISRAHEIRMPEPGWLEVAGGKLTTYRLIAEQVVDRVFASLNRAPVECRTALEPLLPAENVRARSGILPPPPSKQLVEQFCAEEWALHVDDVMIRRTGWHYYEDHPLTLAQTVTEWMAEILAWDATRQHEELAPISKSRPKSLSRNRHGSPPRPENGGAAHGSGTGSENRFPNRGCGGRRFSHRRPPQIASPLPWMPCVPYNRRKGRVGVRTYPRSGRHIRRAAGDSRLGAE